MKATKPDTINYLVYLDGATTKWIVNEIYGNPSEELQKVLRSSGPQAYNLFAGFSR